LRPHFVGFSIITDFGIEAPLFQKYQDFPITTYINPDKKERAELED